MLWTYMLIDMQDKIERMGKILIIVYQTHICQINAR